MINFVSTSDVEAVVDYAYTGEIAISKSNAKSILLLATCLDCHELRDTCGRHLAAK